MEGEGHWETLTGHEDYEIWSDYPFQIRRKKNGRIIKEHIDKVREYVICNLNGVPFYKHRLVATQFLQNPNQLPQVDHINHDRTDYHLSNIRWVTPSENMFNMKSNRGIRFEYFKELPAPCQPFLFYNGYDFEGYSIDEEKNIYLHNGLMFRKLRILLDRKRYSYYNLTSIEGKRIQVYLNKID
jgi:hypothetical protein